MIRRIVYFYINTNILKCRLCIFCKLRLFQTCRVSQPVDCQLLSVLVYISVTVCICPSGLFKKLLCSVRIIGNSFHCIISIRETAWECSLCRYSATFHNHRTEAFLVDSHLNSFTNVLILHNFRIHVELSEEATACRTGIDRIIGVSIKQCIVVILKSIGSLNIACLKRCCQSTSICEGFNSNFVYIDFTAPVIFIFNKVDLRWCYVFSNIRTGSCYIGRTAFTLNTIIHVNDRAIWITKIIDDRRARLCCINGKCQSVCINMVNFQIVWCTVMNSDQILQTFLNCFCIHITSAGEFNTITKCDLNSCVIYKLIISCQPWLYFHVVVVFEKSFSYTVTKCTPSGIVIMWVQTCITHLLTVSCCSINKRFFSVSPYACCHSGCQHSSCKNCCDQFLFH